MTCPTILALLLAMSCSEVIAGPRVDIVIGDKAPALERLAADELASQLKRIYEADVKIAATVPADSPNVIFVGSPDTNASMKPFADSWPSDDKKLTDQGHLLRSVAHNNKPALLVGGSSPVATYWAVAEFGHRLGIRSMLFGDLDPVSPPEFKLDGIETLLEPAPRSRGWYLANRTPMDTAAWSLEEYHSFLKQLAKLRFNHVTINIPHDQPFLHLEHAGVRRASATGVFKFDVSGDTPGRKAFGGVKVFEQPFLIGTRTYDDQRAAGEKHLRGVIDAAHELGMTVCLNIPLGELTAEFDAEWKEWWDKLDPKIKRTADVRGPNPHLILDFKKLASDKRSSELLKAQLRALLATYPSVDELQINFTPPELKTFLSQPNLLRRGDGRELVVMGYPGYGPRTNKVEPFAASKGVEVPRGREVIIVGGLMTLPKFNSRVWQDHWTSALNSESGGFVFRQEGDSGLEILPAYWFSRASCGEAITVRNACEQLLRPVCGEGVDERVRKAFELLESAGELITKDGHPSFGFPGFTEANGKETSDLRKQVQDKFLTAMNEMYRANTRARDGGRSFTLYHARQFEFAYEYMNVIQAQRQWELANRAKDTTTEITELEKGIESLNAALNALAAVARNNSDRGLIALIATKDFQPMKYRLSEAERKRN